jgi:SAM-dependent methyltransferase
MTEASARFFDQQAGDYHASRRGGMWPFHRVSAARLQRELRGRVLAAGGLWAQADAAAVAGAVTVADRSLGMLRHWAAKGLTTVRCDARVLPFDPASFDHVVLPLVLHHLAGSHGWAARRQARRALAEAARVLRPGGRLWISEFCVRPWLYALELAVSPLTRLALAAARIPLVVMHSVSFYESALRELGFTEVEAAAVWAPEPRAGDLIQPVIGLPWLVVPRWLYPVSPTLVTGRR